MAEKIDPEVQNGMRAAIQGQARIIEDCHHTVRTIAKRHIDDFHFLDYEVSLFWTCDKSPVGMCVFKLDESGRKTFCRYCGGPTERK